MMNEEYYYIEKFSKGVSFIRLEKRGLTLSSYKTTLGKMISENHTDYQDEESCLKEFTKQKSKLDRDLIEITEDYYQKYVESYFIQLSYGDYEDGKSLEMLFAELDKVDFSGYKIINIGMLGDIEASFEEIIDYLIKNKSRFQHIERFFMGDIDAEECEISWIEQGTYDQFLQAFPHLQKLIIKGGTNLSLGDSPASENLRYLEIITGGLSQSVIDSLINSKFPKLETLVLYLGVDDYGCDIELSSLAKLADKSLFPSLKTLGICNSQEQDDIVPIILKSNLLPQLSCLNLSCGVLTDKGGQILLDNKAKLTHLDLLDLSYHFLSDEMMEKFEALPIEVDLSDKQDFDEDEDGFYNYPMYTE